MRIEADAGEVDEPAAANLADIDRARRPAESGPQCGVRLAMKRELPGQPVSRTGRDNADRDIAERELAGDLVDRAIAAPCDDRACPVRSRRTRQRPRVAAL